MQHILKILQRADHLVRGRLNALENAYLIIVQHYGVVPFINVDYRELADVLPYALKVMSGALLQCSRDTESHYDSRNRGMYSGVQHSVPQHKPDTYIESLCPDLAGIGSHHNHDAEG